MDDRPALIADNWGLGLNNRSPRDRLPAGSVRDLVNFDAGTSLSLRAGYQTVYEGTDIRGALSYKTRLIILDGTNLIEYDTLTRSPRVLREVTAGGTLAGTVLNDELFFCTANETLRYDGNIVRAWGVPAVATQPQGAAVSGAGTPEGPIQVAVTFRDAYGMEGGTTAARVVSGGTGRDIVLTGIPTPPEGGQVCIYVSPPHSTTLYFYASTNSSTFRITGGVRDDQAPLVTQFETPPQPGEIVTAHKGSLLIAQGKVVWVTSPLRPHAVSRMSGFFMFASNVTVIQPVSDGVYISADATYFLSNIQLEPTLTRVYDSPMQAGSAVTEATGSVVWLSKDGYLRGAPGGAVSPITGDRFVPLLTDRGASAVVLHDGRRMMVTTLKGIPRGNPLGATDFFQSEIIRHE